MGHISGTWELLLCEYWRKSMIIGEKNTEKTDRATKTSLFDRNWATSLKPLRLVWWALGHDRQSSEQNNRKLISLHNAMARTINMHTDLQISSCWEHISTWNMPYVAYLLHELLWGTNSKINVCFVFFPSVECLLHCKVIIRYRNIVIITFCGYLLFSRKCQPP